MRRSRTSFIGREAQLVELSKLIPSTPIVTLVGPGGTGKTRLAIELTKRLTEDFPDRVWVVELAPLADPSLVPSAVHAVVAGEDGATTSLIELLAARRGLLVLDNCEHLVEACAELADELADSCPDLCILSTSRHHLGVGGEVVYDVPPLSCPQDGTPPPEELLQYEAVRLFEDRASQVRRGFELDPDTADAVVRICRRLNGIPLAIELAAARVRVLTPAEIEGRLAQSFSLLRSTERGVVPRQRTLRELIDWSHDLLSTDERRLFARLAVFAGPFDLDAVRAVCAPEDADVEELLVSLVDNSLVHREERSGRSVYVMLEALREYGQERAAESDDVADLRARHLAWFTELARRASEEIEGSGQMEWLARLDLHHDDLRAALDLADPPDSLRLAASLARFWQLRGYLSEGRERIDAALEATVDVPDADRAAALNAAARLAHAQRDHEAVARYAFGALEAATGSGWKQGEAQALSRLGSSLLMSGDVVAAKERYEQALGRFRDIDDRDGDATATYNLGVIAHEQGRLDDARDRYEEVVAYDREIGDRAQLAEDLVNLAQIAREQADLDRAGEIMRESLDIQRELGTRGGMIPGLHTAARIELSRGDLDAAEVLAQECADLSRELGNRLGLMGAMEVLGNVLHARGDLVAAERALTEGLGIARASHLTQMIPQLLRELGHVAIARGRTDEGRTRLAESVEAYRRLGRDAEANTMVSELGEEKITPAAAPERRGTQAVLRREGDVWIVAYGDVRAHLKNVKGLRYLATLLASPGEVHVLDLVAAVEGTGPSGRRPDAGLEVASGNAGPVLDPQAKAAYRARLEELQEQIEEAEAWNDPERAARARDEMDAILAQLRAGLGLGGRDRAGSSDAERARSAAGKAVKSAIARVKREVPELGHRLEACVTTGIFCSYTPDPFDPLDWNLG